MKKPQFDRKLKLSKQTVARLSEPEMLKAMGGKMCTSACNHMCNTIGTCLGPLRTIQGDFWSCFFCDVFEEPV